MNKSELICDLDAIHNLVCRAYDAASSGSIAEAQTSDAMGRLDKLLITLNSEVPVAEPVPETPTLRDTFATAALVMLPHHGCGADLDIRETAEAAYQIADAMMAARGNRPS